MTTQKCSICQRTVPTIERYPRYCCDVCIARAKNRAGQDVRFFNTELTGHGIIACTKESKSTDPYCTIDGILCIAEEGRFGGIVVQRCLNTPSCWYVRFLHILMKHVRGILGRKHPM